MNQGVQVDLQPEHQRLVLEILRTNLPPDSRVWVFGSRATAGGAIPISIWRSTRAGA